ncbi:MAG: 3-dehydroquinate synthase [Deltaproteobacteria bacterium]|nr:3-dehydroquinate synthase [Deltaproteobacteria bacterium]
MERIDLSLKEEEKRCEIFIGSGVIDFLVADLEGRPLGNRLAIITDSTVEGLLGRRLSRRLCDAGIKTDLIAFSPGEEAKRWKTVKRIFEQLLAKGLDRKSALVALGGGVVGDVTGFVASLYMRSIPYVQVPTTLLAQSDSSLGGKNGIDLAQGKNLLGTVYQPSRVYVDPSVLRSLPPHEFRNGLAEVIKSAVIRSAELFRLLEDSRAALLEHRSGVLEEMVSRCCQIKCAVVADDERDTGLRRILNFGHTVGHAIETYTDYQVPHGMAVSMGMASEAALSARMGILSDTERRRLLALLGIYGLPTRIPEGYNAERILALMASDKKTEEGRIAMALPTTIGDAVVKNGIPKGLILETLKEAQA